MGAVHKMAVIIIIIIIVHILGMCVCYHATNAVLHSLHHFHAGFLTRRARTLQVPRDTAVVSDTASLFQCMLGRCVFVLAVVTIWCGPSL
jgi:hypothetical protein